MDILHAVQELLLKKQQEILSFEEVTQNMLSCVSEKLTECMQQREDIIQCIDKIDAEIEQYCSQYADRERFLKIIHGSADETDLSSQEAELLCIAKGIRAVFSRLEESDLQAALRLRLEEEQILEQIKSTNQGSTAKAARFFTNDPSQRTGTSLLRNV